MNKYLIFSIIFCTLSTNSLARPVSYSGGTTVMQRNEETKNSLHIHYSPSYKYSVGYRGEYIRKNKISLNGLQLNNLLKRWNKKNSQGNLYLKSNIGNAQKSGNNDIYGFVGFSADFETRRYFVSYENRYYKSDKNIINQFEQNARIGIAPYIANYGGVHSWLMLKVSHQPKLEGDEIIVIPLIRLFKKSNLVELGVGSNKSVLFNLIVRF